MRRRAVADSCLFLRSRRQVYLYPELTFISFTIIDYFDPTRTVPASPPLTLDSTAVSLPSKENKASHAIEFHKPISYLKRTFHDMNFPNQDEDYSPNRNRPAKRQRTRFYNDPDATTCQLFSPITTSRPLASAAIKTNTDLNGICERGSSKEPVPNAHLASCYPTPSTSRSFPFVDLGLSFHRRLPKNLVPLQIRQVCLTRMEGRKLMISTATILDIRPLTQIRMPSSRPGTESRTRLHFAATDPTKIIALPEILFV